jgi:ATP-dependent helicase/nuclease subunit A
MVDANAGAGPAETYEPLIDWPPGDEVPAHFSMLTVKDETGAGRAYVMAVNREAAAREELNLLYVAMTRARQVLLVSGAENGRAGDDSAFRLIRRAVAAEAGIGDDGTGAIALGEVEIAAPGVAAAPAARAAPASAMVLPMAIGNRRAPASAEQFDGIALHGALQWLAQARDDGAAPPDDDTLLRRVGVPGADVVALRAAADAVFAEPALRRFFDPARFVAAHNELEIVSAAGTRRIDRLVRFEDEAWVLDYKRTVGDEVSEEYAAQVRDYMRQVANLHPGLAVRGGLVDVGRRRLVPVAPVPE